MLWSDLSHLVWRGLGEAMASQYEYWSTAEIKAAVDALPEAAFGALAQTLTEGAASLSDALRGLETAWAAARVHWRGPAADAAQEAATRTSAWVGQVASLSARTAANASTMQQAVSAAKVAMPPQVVASYRPGGPPVPPAQQVAAQQQQLRAAQAVQTLADTAAQTGARGPGPGEWPQPLQGTAAGGPVFTPAGRPGGGTGMARFGDMGGAVSGPGGGGSAGAGGATGGGSGSAGRWVGVGGSGSGLTPLTGGPGSDVVGVPASPEASGSVGELSRPFGGFGGLGGLAGVLVAGGAGAVAARSMGRVRAGVAGAEEEFIGGAGTRSGYVGSAGEARESERLARARAMAKEGELLAAREASQGPMSFLPAGLGGRHRDDDRETTRPSYLVEVEDYFGAPSELVAPAVIGEWDDEEARR
jgi:hypothetical protein